MAWALNGLLPYLMLRFGVAVCVCRKDKEKRPNSYESMMRPGKTGQARSLPTPESVPETGSGEKQRKKMEGQGKRENSRLKVLYVKQKFVVSFNKILIKKA